MFSLKRKKKAVVVGIAHRILLSSYYFLRSSKEAFSHLLRKKFKILKPSVDLLLSFSLFWNLINGTKTYVFANSRASKSKSKNTNNEGREDAVKRRRILDEEREKNHHRHRYFHKHK